MDEDVGADKIWAGGRGSNYISEVDDYFDEMTDIIHAAPFFERNRKGNNFFVLRKLCITVTSTLIKQFSCDPIVSSLIEKYVTVDTQRAGGPVEKTWTGNL